MEPHVAQENSRPGGPDGCVKESGNLLSTDGSANRLFSTLLGHSCLIYLAMSDLTSLPAGRNCTGDSSRARACAPSHEMYYTPGKKEAHGQGTRISIAGIFPMVYG